MDDDDAYELLIARMNPPRVVIDNDSTNTATIIQVDRGNKHGILLEVVQLLTDLNLIITKAYISSDGIWFMDVFNVTDRDGNKLRDGKIINYIKTSLETDVHFATSVKNLDSSMLSKEYNSIELTGADRPGLLSEVCAVLTGLKCNVVRAEVWSHNTRAAAVVHVTDEATGLAIEDPQRLTTVKKLLCDLLKGNGDARNSKMMVSAGLTHTERRLHQMMFDDRDYERLDLVEDVDDKRTTPRPQVAVMDCTEKGYSVVMLKSPDRPKLLFDTICTLTDMQYVVFHGTVEACGAEAYQEYYIRHSDGCPVSSEGERRRVIQCLEAAIERRSSGGLELELCTEDRVGLLSDITRIFRENGLYIKRAEISTKGGTAIDSFCVSEMSGEPVEAETINSVRGQIGDSILKVKQQSTMPSSKHDSVVSNGLWFQFRNLFRSCSLESFWLI